MHGLTCLVAILAASAAESPVRQRAEHVKGVIEKEYTLLDGLYKQLHRHPELSYQEAKTSARLADELRRLGFEVTEHVGGHGVVGVLKNGDGPTVLIRTDM